MKRALLFIPTLLSLTALPSRAQEEEKLQPPPPVPGKASIAIQAPSLKDGLMLLDWDPARRGPLLLIGAEKAVLKGKTVPPPRNGYGLPELVGYFDLQTARFPTLTTAGPVNMTVLSTPTVSSFNGMQEYFRQANPLPLLESLEPGQIQQALSPAGLGYAALNSERQRTLWEKMLPMTLTFQESPLPEGMPPAMLAGQSPWWGNEKLPLLSPSALRSFRLRLSLDLSLTAQPGGYDISFKDPRGRNTQVALKAMPVGPDKLDQQRREQEKLTSTQKLPYRRKLSDLDPTNERFAVPISLEGVETVGALTQRIAQAIRVELYADKRIAGLSVFVKALPDQQVSAGDALGAILRATCFTIRRLEAGRDSAYVITFDRVPLGNQSVVLFDNILPQMMREMQNMLSMAQESAEASRKLRKKDLLKNLTRGEGAQAPESLWKAAMANQTAPIPLASLPSEVNERAQAVWTRVQAYKNPEGTPPPQRPQAVLPVGAVHVLLVADGLGWAALTQLAIKDLTPPEPPPLVTLPSNLKTRTLLVNPPPDAAAAKRLVISARERGFNQLAVFLSGDANDDTKLGWLLAGKDALPVMPVLSPLMPAPTDTQRERDISVTGRTAAELGMGRAALGEITKIVPYITPVFRQITRLDALTPEAVPVERFATRVAKLAALSGVSSVGMISLLVPGYDPNQGGGNLETLWAGGYSATERLAFLRAKGSDPSDFLELEGIGNIELPYFGSGRDEQMRLWNERRKERGVQLRKRLDTALQAVKLTKPLWQFSESAFFSELGTWKPWKGGVAGPSHLPYWQALARRLAGTMGPGSDSSLLDDTGILRVWLTERLKPAPANPDQPNENPFAAQGVSPAGFVLDLSDLSFLESLALVEAVVAPAVAKPQAP